MPTYAYKAKRGPTEALEGTIDAETADAAISRLQDQGLIPIRVQEAQPTVGGPRPTAAPAPPTVVRAGRIRSRDIEIFTRQFASLIRAKVTPLRALMILADQCTNARFKTVILAIQQHIREGKTLTEAFGQFPQTFSGVYVSLIRTGEVGGLLEEVLTKLAEFKQQEEQMRLKIKTALAYPTLMALVGMATIFVLLTFVLPRLVVLFEDMGQVLPLPTRIMIGISHVCVRYWPLIIGAVAGAALLLRRQRFSRAERLLWDGAALRLPVVGRFVVEAELANFARTLGLLLGSGVPVFQAIDVAVPMLTNAVLQQAFQRVKEEIVGGASLARSLRGIRQVPPFVQNMVGVGEEGGRLKEALLEIAAAYDLEVDQMLKTVTSLIEPLVIVVMGSIVGFIVAAMLLPIFQLNLTVR